MSTKSAWLPRWTFFPLSLHAAVPIIEDAACAIGSSYKRDLIGRPINRMACYSFHPRKILTNGEGGMITTDEDELGERLRRLRQHAMSLSDVARHNSQILATETYDEVGCVDSATAQLAICARPYGLIVTGSVLNACRQIPECAREQRAS